MKRVVCASPSATDLIPGTVRSNLRVAFAFANRAVQRLGVTECTSTPANLSRLIDLHYHTYRHVSQVLQESAEESHRAKLHCESKLGVFAVASGHMPKVDIIQVKVLG